MKILRDEKIFGGDLSGCPAGKCATNRWSIRALWDSNPRVRKRERVRFIPDTSVTRLVNVP